MKNLFLCLFGLVLISCSSVTEYSLTAKLDGLEEGMAYLNKRVGAEWQAVDSVDVTEGTFMFTGAVDMPDYDYITLEGKSGRLTIFSANQDITITVYADTLQQIQITVSTEPD